jgi:heptosyltransferase-2
MTRLIVFAPNWLGDAVMALPAIADLRRAMPQAALDVAARPAVAPLFTMVPGVQEVVPVEEHGVTARTLRDRGYDAALLLPNSFNSALLARRAGIQERWGYRGDFRSPLLTRAVAAPPRVHQAAYYQHLVRELGFPNGLLEPRVVVADETRRRALATLAAAGWNAQSPLVAVAPGAAYGGAKRWPATSYAALASALSERGSTTVLIGSQGDATAGLELLAAIDANARAIDLIGRTDLPMLAGVLVHCRALVTNDSGAMHLAAALGIDVTAMFGPTNERETRPLGRGRLTVLTHPVWCRPCMLRECPLTHACMRGIPVGVVRDAVAGSL